jgi:hypothetical protein
MSPQSSTRKSRCAKCARITVAPLVVQNRRTREQLRFHRRCFIALLALTDRRTKLGVNRAISRQARRSAS